MVYKSTNDSLDRYSILQNLSEKHGLASLSGLVPCGAPSPGCSVAWGLQRRVPRVMLQSGVTQVWLSGSQRQEPTCVCYAPSVARKVWMTSWVDVEASGEIPHVYVPNISHLSKTECDYSLCSWTLRRILSIDLLEHIPFFFLKYVATPWDQAVKWVLAPAHYEVKDPQSMCCENVSKGGCCQW